MHGARPGIAVVDGGRLRMRELSHASDGGM
jgi:hypothetical protein